jgi:hypothetical protein
VASKVEAKILIGDLMVTKMKRKKLKGGRVVGPDWKNVKNWESPPIYPVQLRITNSLYKTKL